MIKSILWGLRYALSKNPKLVILKWVTTVLITLTPLVLSLVWADLIDTVITLVNSNSLDITVLLMPILFYAFVELIKSASTWYREYLATRVYDILEGTVNTDVLKKYSSLSFIQLEDPEITKLFQIISESYSWRVRSLSFTFGDTLSALVALVFSSTVMLTVSPQVALIVIVSSLPTIFLNNIFVNIEWGIWHADSNNYRKFNLTKDFLLDKSNLLEAKVNNITEYLVGEIKNILDGYHNKRIPAITNRSLVMFLSDILKIIGTIVSLYILITSAISGAITVGEVILVSSVFVGFSTSLRGFLYEVSNLYESGYFFNDFMRFMSLPSEESNSKKIKYSIPPVVEFENVVFKYPNTQRFVLDGVSFKILRGQKVALVGENGAGKSTLIKLLCQFYPPTTGNIYIDGEDLNIIDKESWENNLGLLTQHFNPFKAYTLKQNIFFGDVSKAVDQLKIEDAMNKSKVSTFASNYTNGLDTQLSVQFEGGIDPSHGQWQRIGIARTLYRDSNIIILDEPTSAIDAQAEYEIFNNINEHTKGKTVIYVSHRYSTVRNADVIYVLNDGKIAESGNHKELMNLKGIYYKNFSLQAQGYK